MRYLIPLCDRFPDVNYYGSILRVMLDGNVVNINVDNNASDIARGSFKPNLSLNYWKTLNDRYYVSQLAMQPAVNQFIVKNFQTYTDDMLLSLVYYKYETTNHTGEGFKFYNNYRILHSYSYKNAIKFGNIIDATTCSRLYKYCCDLKFTKCKEDDNI